MDRLDKGWAPNPKKGPIIPTRKLGRKAITQTRPSYVRHLEEILPYGKDSRVEAEIEHEYLPFSMAKLALPSCEAVTPEVEAACGILIEGADGCTCWFNMPTFKSDSFFIRSLAQFAALIKVPSRITTFVEMALAGSRNGTQHVMPLRDYESPAFSLHTCDIGEERCASAFTFTKSSRLRLFRGKPATIKDVAAALASLA